LILAAVLIFFPAIIFSPFTWMIASTQVTFASSLDLQQVLGIILLPILAAYLLGSAVFLAKEADLLNSLMSLLSASLISIIVILLAQGFRTTYALFFTKALYPASLIITTSILLMIKRPSFIKHSAIFIINPFAVGAYMWVPTMLNLTATNI